MTARTGASSSKRIAKPDVPRKQSRRANLTLDSESVASDRQPDPTSRRRQTALPYSLSNSAQTPSIGLSPISTAVVQHALPASAWSSGSRGGQTHAYQYPRPSSASSHYTNHHAGARLPYSPSLGHFDDRPGGDSDSGAGGPNFSHIPGFPLNLEILADDAGSIMSSSTRVRGGPAQTSEAASRLFRKMRGAVGRAGITLDRSPRLTSKLQGLSKDYWMPDEDAKECYDCGSRFTAWRRKHHCRICGAHPLKTWQHLSPLIDARRTNLLQHLRQQPHTRRPPLFVRLHPRLQHLPGPARPRWRRRCIRGARGVGTAQSGDVVDPVVAESTPTGRRAEE